MATMDVIEKLAQRFAGIKGKLTREVELLNEEREAAVKMHLPAIKRLSQSAREAQAELLEAVQESRELFEKPKSRELHGVKCGYRKGSGKVEWEDDEQVVKLIRKHLPEQAEILIIVKEKPSKAAIAQLPAADVKRIGCTVEDTKDVAFVADADSEVDKLVKALLEEESEEAA